MMLFSAARRRGARGDERSARHELADPPTRPSLTRLIVRITSFLPRSAFTRAVASVRDAHGLDREAEGVGVLEGAVDGVLARAAALGVRGDERLGQQVAADLILVALGGGGLEVLDGVGDQALLAAELARGVLGGRLGGATGDRDGGDRGEREQGSGACGPGAYLP